MFYLIDSNAVIDYLAAKLPAASMAKMNNIVNESLFISVITQIETLGFDRAMTQKIEIHLISSA
ncbi:MAG: hypothetical protein H0X70_02215 [Segetibacter sp.]|nr:hypothetical protein [Segetibacter sp.]